MTIPDPAAGQSGDEMPGESQHNHPSTSARAQGGEKPSPSPLSLPRLERTGPQRLAATIGRFDDTTPAEGDTRPTPGRPLVSARDVIEHGIRVAQEVIDQQIGSGERILRHLRRAPIRKRRISPLDANSAATLTERTVILYRELGVLTLELLETLLETPTTMQVLARWLGLQPQPGGGGAGGRASSSGRQASGPAPPQYLVQISSQKFAVGEISWLPGAVVDEPHVEPLTKKDAPPIESIEFLPEAQAFRVAIGADHPAGVYAGPIMSQRTGRRLGALLVTISAD